MYAVYGNIYHQYIPNVGIYTSTMDPMGNIRYTPSFGVTRISFSEHPSFGGRKIDMFETNNWKLYLFCQIQVTKK